MSASTMIFMERPIPHVRQRLSDLQCRGRVRLDREEIDTLVYALGGVPAAAAHPSQADRTVSLARLAGHPHWLFGGFAIPGIQPIQDG